MSTGSSAAPPIALVWENAQGKQVRVEELTRDELLAALHRCVVERDFYKKQLEATLRMMRPFSPN